MTHRLPLQPQAHFHSLTPKSDPQLVQLKSLLSLSSLLTPRFTKPVFVLSSPRSGSTHFYEIARRLEQVMSFDAENDPMWLRLFPYDRFDIPTDYVAASECDALSISAVKAFTFWKSFFKPSRSEANVFNRNLLQRRPVLYMDKTIANCFHLEALEKIFPDALYIHLVRDGRACVSSILEGWHQGVGRKREGIVPLPAGASISYWCYPLPLGWMDVVERSLEEICAWLWIEHNRYVLEKCQTSPSFNQQCLRVSYEHLVANPLEVMEQVSAFTGLGISSACTEYINQNAPSRTTVSAPKSDKWKEKNLDAINKILPMITPMMEQLA